MDEGQGVRPLPPSQHKMLHRRAQIYQHVADWTVVFFVLRDPLFFTKFWFM